jgi:NADH:ubiquinone oxidoreductase subunit 2 (subunit N)
MIEWILFLPALVPVVGALAFGFARRTSSRSRDWLAIAFLAIEIVAILVNIAPMDHQVLVSNWKSGSFSLAFEIDGISLLLLLSMFIVMVSLWLTAPPRSPFDPLPGLVLTAAVLLVMASNPITIYFSWVLLDIAIFMWRIGRDIERETALRALTLSQMAGLALFAGSAFTGTPYAAQGVLAIAVAFWARLGLFPFHWVYPLRGANSRDLWVSRAVPLLASASLWIHWSLLQPAAFAQLLVVLATVALIATMAWAWREEQPARAVVISTWHGVALIPLAIAYGGDAGIAFALWTTTSAAFAVGIFEMALRWRAENRNRWVRIIWLIGMLAAAGLPGSPAFLGRAGIYVAMWETGNGWLVILAGLATTVALAPLWSFGVALEGAEERDPTRAEYAGLVILLLALVALSFAPMPIAHVLSPDLAVSADAALLHVVWTNNLLGVIVSLAILILPFILSFPLRHVAREFRPKQHSLASRLVHLFDLEWFDRSMSGIGLEMGAAARNLSTIAEENPAVWILLVAIWIAIFVLIPR